MSFDVLTVGEAMLRLSVPAGDHLESTRTLDVHVAGAEANTALALAQIGRSVTWVSALPDSPLGERVARDLRAGGVDVSHVRWVPDARMGVYFVELSAPPRPVSVVYDRVDTAAARMDIRGFPFELLTSSKVVHLSGITPALSESCRRLAIDVADHARSGPCLLTVDINYRAKLWSPQDANKWLTQMATGADLVLITLEDARDVFGITGEPQEVASAVKVALSADTVVVTLGDLGSVWESGNGSGRVEAIPTTVIDRLGAGDAFAAGVIDGLLTEDLERGIRVGTALASLTLGTHGDHVVTNRDEVDRLIQGGGRSVDR